MPLSQPNPVMQSEYAINGTHGRLYLDGEIVSEVQSVAGTMRLSRRDIMRAGSRAMAYKGMTVGGEGSISYIKVTSRFLKHISEPFRDPTSVQRAFDLRYIIDDPESLGTEEAVLSKVRFWEVPFGFQVNDIIEEQISFTFETFRFLNTIEGDPTISTIQSKYVPLD